MGNATEVAWLGEADCHHPALTGGKAASLSRLAAAHRVPPGFCITTATHERVQAALRGRHLTAEALPGEVREAVARAYRSLGQRCGAEELPVAVRSSAVDEDGRSSSFAGQYDTFLNVRGVEAVISAAAGCWQSADDGRVRVYRSQVGPGAEEAPMAVLVQRLVVADVSAVAFSVSPVGGGNEHVLINASWGLGESIVGGTVTPDSYLVRRDDGSIAGRQVAEKARMTVAAAGGTSEVEVPRRLRGRPALDDSQVEEIAQLALHLEATCEWPVDIECAYERGSLYLLQCRPITTIR